jgi:hypothetical protein
VTRCIMFKEKRGMQKETRRPVNFDGITVSGSKKIWKGSKEAAFCSHTLPFSRTKQRRTPRRLPSHFPDAIDLHRSVRTLTPSDPKFSISTVSLSYSDGICNDLKKVSSRTYELGNTVPVTSLFAMVCSDSYSYKRRNVAP